MMNMVPFNKNVLLENL
ncbi:hypothetical protein [Plasmodium yoelii yoelii]|uniref:Uncharacterized protein n=1 Tax=Plasmodium yoelii yoelii TaxID=73239 RepID=Q7PD45_PLAYO|nr:hypothetical protein [Plasmodium yoelii yoelii]EAA22357.1 hypothetical protein [Plasmodium yoelii yoelii]